MLSDMFVPGTTDGPLLVLARESNAIAARALDAANSINTAIAAASANLACGAIGYLCDTLLPARFKGFAILVRSKFLTLIKFALRPILLSPSERPRAEVIRGHIRMLLRSLRACEKKPMRPRHLRAHLSARFLCACQSEKLAKGPV